MPAPQPTLDELDPGATGPERVPDPVEYLLFALRAVARRKLLVAGVLLSCLAVLTTYFVTKPPLYVARTRILAQAQGAGLAIVADDRPTRAARDIIVQRDNLVELLKRAELFEGSPEPRPSRPVPSGALAQALDRLTGLFADEDDPLEALLLKLDKRLLVETDEVTITIELEWPDPLQAYRIVDGALQNFLEARHVQEVTAIDETIADLEARAAGLRAELTKATEETRRAILQDAARTAGAPPRPVAAPLPAATPGSLELVRLRSMVEAKERAIGDVEEFRRRRLAELQAQYESRRSIYAEAHPEMVNLRNDIATLTRDSSQIAALRAEERRLREEYEALLAKESPSRLAAAGGPEPSPRQFGESINAAVEASERVRDARTRYQEVLASVNRAQGDRDVARSAFKHRYKVIWPAQVPRRPSSPNPLKVFGIGGLASVLLALVAAVALEWRSGRVQERWQVERGLGVPVLWDESGR